MSAFEDLDHLLGTFNEQEAHYLAMGLAQPELEGWANGNAHGIAWASRLLREYMIEHHLDA